MGNFKKSVKAILTAINVVMPKGKMISFCSNPDFSDNPQALYAFMLKNSKLKDYTFVWHLQDKNKKENIQSWIEDEFQNRNIRTLIVPKYSVASVFYYMRSKILISSHGLYDFQSKKQKHVLLWHGMPLKKIGYMNEKDVSHGITTGDYYSVTAPVFQELFTKIFKAKKEQVYICGQPRNDYLFEKFRYSKANGSDYYIYMPTFRKTNSKLLLSRQDATIIENKLFNLSKEEWKSINKLLMEQSRLLYVKPHPLDSVEHLDYLDNCPNIKLINDQLLLEEKVPLYRFIAGSCGMITDYSSVFIDYVLTGGSLAFFIPDFDEYRDNRGFVFDNVESTLPGKICLTSEDLIAYFKDSCFEEDRYHSISNYLNSVLEATSSYNIYEKIISKIL
ncbi:CDP-glycerol glycerophosphotransferase family protein [Neobacillus muris]|uniref:CDP-glycerol glycerophosphotransferase family protein n=1 Tax=Neobacillus muris TaxID=2941334 RepID=UPI00203D0CE2|nr:CDP-glycerol glycerophosphotransferase family protein [Neobacillus muris]